MDTCLLCGEKKGTVLLNAGPHPIAHRYLEETVTKEYIHPFILTFCVRCGHMQLDDPIPPDIMYANYICFSSWKFQPHIPLLLKMIEEIPGLKKTSRILEVGSNDGMFMKRLKDKGYSDVMGIEPAQDVRKMAESLGVKTIPGYFEARTANEFLAAGGKCDFLLSRQTLEHIQDLEKFSKTMQMVIKPGGYVLIEIPDFLTNLNTCDYTLWEEHENYFTLDTLNYFFAKNGIKTIDAKTILFAGASLIALGQYDGKPQANPSLEYVPGLREKAYRYRDNYSDLRRRFNDYLREQGRLGKKIAIYGAGAR